METATSGDITYYRFANLAKYDEVIHGVFTRSGGVSDPPFTSLNTSFAVNDNRESVITNRRLLCQSLNVPYTSLVVAKQVHGTHVAIIEETPRPDDPNEWYEILPPSDAMLTIARGRTLLMTFADCVPVLLYDPVNHIAGIAHGGWKGTVARIAEHAVEVMMEKFNSNSSELIAAVGPSIGPCCYEVGDEVISTVRKSFANADELLKPGPKGTIHFNLWEANRSLLQKAGIPAAQIEVAGICTADNTDTFYSHRAERGRTGRFAVVIGLSS